MIWAARMSFACRIYDQVVGGGWSGTVCAEDGCPIQNSEVNDALIEEK